MNALAYGVPLTTFAQCLTASFILTTAFDIKYSKHTYMQYKRIRQSPKVYKYLLEPMFTSVNAVSNACSC